MEKEYAQALVNALAKGTDEATAVRNLLASLRERGRLKLLPGILRELKARKAAADGAVIEVADRSGEDAALRAARAAGIEARDAIVNPSLISGWRARQGGRLVDRSGKRALLELYQNVTT